MPRGAILEATGAEARRGHSDSEQSPAWPEQTGPEEQGVGVGRAPEEGDLALSNTLVFSSGAPGLRLQRLLRATDNLERLGT